MKTYPLQEHCQNRRIVSCLISLLGFCAIPSMNAQPAVSVAHFGAKPDGILRTDGAMSAGAITLTSQSATFTSADVGKYIQVIGAGPGGTSGTDGVMSAQSAVLSSPSAIFASTDIGRGIIVLGAGPLGGNLITTIAGFNSPQSVTLNAAAALGLNNAAYSTAP